MLMIISINPTIPHPLPLNHYLKNSLPHYFKSLLSFIKNLSSSNPMKSQNIKNFSKKEAKL